MRELVIRTLMDPSCIEGREGARPRAAGAGCFSDRYPSASNSHWIPWLQKQLLIKGHDVQTPEVVRPYLVDYDGWRTEFERHLDDEPMISTGLPANPLRSRRCVRAPRTT
jgi:hypothetical protein